MYIVANPRDIQVIYEQGDVPENMGDIKECIWPYSVYAKLKKEAYKDAFKETNEYLRDLPKETVHRLVRFFENCKTIISTHGTPKVLISEIRNQVSLIHDIIDFRKVRDWNIKEDSFPFRKIEKVALMKKELLRDTTYNEESTNDLTCLCLSIKILTPIFGTLAEMVKKVTSNAWKERKILEILLDTEIEKSDAYQKLQLYCYGRADLAKNKISAASHRGMTLEKLKQGTLANAIIRFLAVYPISNEKDIVRALYQETTTYLNTSSVAEFIDKATVSGKSGNDEDSTTQQWRRGQDTRPSDRSMATRYIKNSFYTARDLKLAENIPDIKTISKEINKKANELIKSPIAISKLHVSLIGLAFTVDSKQLLSARILSAITDRTAFRRAQVAASYRFEKLGCPGLAKFLIDPYKEIDLGDLSANSSIVIRPLTPEQQQQLVELYPLLNVNVSARNLFAETPGFKLIEKVTKFIIDHDYSDKHVFENIRTEMVERLVNL